MEYKWLLGWVQFKKTLEMVAAIKNVHIWLTVWRVLSSELNTENCELAVAKKNQNKNEN